ncbi:sensor histidine kinase [Flavobacterium sp.]|uniref:tetratricopeptide repeat-containing sensor histidine kinase n=1 Tax=Flavobacterium sp. TaxID=239 RepID=UPI00286B01CF|nr:sensor histidine kinase [Flavobacterium sp.]
MQRILFVSIILMNGFLFAQNNLKFINENISKGKFESAKKELDKIDLANYTDYERANYYIAYSKIYQQENKEDQYFKKLIEAKEIYIKIDSIEKALKLNLDIAYLVSTMKNKPKNISEKKLIQEYLDYALKTNNKTKIAFAYYEIASIKICAKKDPEVLTNFRNAIKINNEIKNENLTLKINKNLAAYFNEAEKLPDSALKYLNRCLPIALKKNDIKSINDIYINQAGSYNRKKKYAEAIVLLNKALELDVDENALNNKCIINYFLYKNYKEIKNTPKALEYLEKYNILNDDLNQIDQELAINELQTKYETKEKDLENKNLKTIIYSVIGLLFVIGIISVLAYKNLSKKKKIVEQEKQLETQKLETKLKEQELHEIDVMLESQEKERQRIANELHDNLGSMLATLKLNFENLKRHDTGSSEKEFQLFEKTDSLIEEAYQKVRNISHLKNLGVIGSEGLVVAVKKMAEKMSVLEKLQINVIPHGLNERLENTLEVMLFRIIQELCTNIMKHSEATEVNIYLTQHNSNELNIIIEDNGKGFDPKSIVQKSGIGLKSIEKKVEQMNGTFTIDSIISKGTTIIIDLPI